MTPIEETTMAANNPEQRPESESRDDARKRVFARAATAREEARRCQDRARNLRQAAWLQRELKNRRIGQDS